MLGWFVAHAGVPLDLEDAVVKLHKKSFPRENSVFIMKDPVEQEEKYFVHQMNDLLEISGHYTYYEKNPCMQNYMISCRKKNGVCPTENWWKIERQRISAALCAIAEGGSIRGRQAV